MSVLCEQEYVYSKYITTFNSFQLFAISLDLSFQVPTVYILAIPCFPLELLSGSPSIPPPPNSATPLLFPSYSPHLGQ